MGFVDDFFGTLQTYNETVLPVTVVSFFLGIIAVYLAARRSEFSSRMISAILSLLWIWSGIVFFVVFFGPTDVEFLGFTVPGVWYLGGALFFIQSILFILLGVIKNSLSFKMIGSKQSIIGASMVIYAMITYPLVGVLTGSSYPRYPVFGTAPCPLTIFTLGLLQWNDRRLPPVIAVIPFIWSLMGTMPVLVLDIWADIGELLSGIIGFPLILIHNRRFRTRSQ